MFRDKEIINLLGPVARIAEQDKEQLQLFLEARACQEVILTKMEALQKDMDAVMRHFGLKQ